MPRQRNGFGTNPTAFTLTELLAVVAIVGLLLALLLPVLAAARESSRRVVCQNNLKQIGVALVSYENTYSKFPVGAQRQVTFGVSWWVGILPFLEEVNTYAKFDLTGAHNGSAMMHGANGKLVNQLVIESMVCPSSPFARLWPVGNYEVMMPSYVGLAGASNYNGFPETRVSACCTSDANSGQISAGGVLIPNRAVRLREITDGISKTLVVGETSNSALNAQGIEERVDGAFPQGWITGTSAAGTPPNYNPSFSPSSWNITTLRYAPNTRNYNLPGLGRNRGANNPLISAHPQGVLGLLIDGSVQFLPNDIDIRALKLMATRDDRQLY
jgi:type II secretory pathway pseudopilin PulG